MRDACGDTLLFGGGERFCCRSGSSSRDRPDVSDIRGIAVTSARPAAYGRSSISSASLTGSVRSCAVTFSNSAVALAV